MKSFLYRYLMFITILSGIAVVASCQQRPLRHQDIPQQSSKLRVIIIRHGEKPENGNNLSCQGLNRALQLSKVLSDKFGVVGGIYVPALKQGESTTSARMFETVVPYAVKTGLNINTQFGEGDEDQLAKFLTTQTGTQLVVWEHQSIVDIVNALGISKKKLKWPGNDFDSIWIISFDENGQPTMTFDKEGINPGSKCEDLQE